MQAKASSHAASDLTTSHVMSVFAAFLAFSVFFVNPLFESVMFSHVAMTLVIGIWLLTKSPKAAFVAITASVIFFCYLLVVSEFVQLGDRVVNESVKYFLLILFVSAVMYFPVLARKSLYFLAFFMPALLLLYVLLSPDPFVYGGRLGVAVTGGDEDAMISANTIGFVINVCVATLLARRSKSLYYLAPVFLILLYLTLSRGAILSLGFMGVAYFIKTRKFVYVFGLGILCIILFIDMNTSMLQTYRLDDATGSGRTILYEMMFDEMKANPITFLIGNGPGNVNFEIYAGKTLVSAHNGYLELLYTFGLFGVAAVVFFFTRTVRNYSALPMDTLLYAVLLASYAISEDMMGAHTLIVMGLMLGVILCDFGRSGRKRAEAALANYRLGRA